MPEVMANNANGNVTAINGQRDPSPELRQPGCFGKLWCLGSSRKRGMRIAPARSEGTGNNSNSWASNGASSSTAANQFVGLSPSLLAPPSSPASFANSGNPSTVHSPASFTVSLCVPTANMVCSPAFDSTATMFTIGPYAHETTLVTPPAFSATSTAPFTPPPELAHLTTPSSPDVPFAQLLASSLKNAKSGGSSLSGPQPAAPYSASPFASPDYISRSGEMQASYHQMYPESPLASLISPASGISESGPPSPLPELEFPAAFMAAGKSTLSIRRITTFAGLELAGKSLLEHSTSSTTTPVSNSLNHSRELEPIKLLSPTKEYHERRESSGPTNVTTSSSCAEEPIEEEERPTVSVPDAACERLSRSSSQLRDSDGVIQPQETSCVEERSMGTGTGEAEANEAGPHREEALDGLIRSFKGITLKVEVNPDGEEVVRLRFAAADGSTTPTKNGSNGYHRAEELLEQNLAREIENKTQECLT